MEITEPLIFWKDINGYENYQISSQGEVKNKITGRFLKGDVNNIGYRRVVLNSLDKHERLFVHRLVALHFVNGYDENLVVNHIDGDKSNNRAKNLEWVTKSENDLHAFRLGLRKVYPCQFKHKIEAYDLSSGETIKIYENTKEASEDLNVCRPNIYSCCNGKQYSCRGVGLRYV